MKNIFRISCMIFCLGLAACSTTPTDKSAESITAGSQKAAHVSSAPFPELDIWLIENKLAINAGKSEAAEYNKAFAQGIVLAYGEGYPLPGAEGAAKKRLTAMRAAEVVAQRNLAEYLAGQASNGQIRFGTYETQLEVFLKGAEVVASEYNPELGKAAALVKLDLKGANGFAK